MNFMWFSSGSAPYRFCHIDAICNPYEYDGYIKSIWASYGNATGVKGRVICVDDDGLSQQMVPILL